MFYIFYFYCIDYYAISCQSETGIYYKMIYFGHEATGNGRVADLNSMLKLTSAYHWFLQGRIFETVPGRKYNRLSITALIGSRYSNTIKVIPITPPGCKYNIAPVTSTPYIAPDNNWVRPKQKQSGVFVWGVHRVFIFLMAEIFEPKIQCPRVSSTDAHVLALFRSARIQSR